MAKPSGEGTDDASALAALIAQGRAAHPDIAAPAGLESFFAARAEAAGRAADPAGRAADVYLVPPAPPGIRWRSAGLTPCCPARSGRPWPGWACPPPTTTRSAGRVRVALMVADECGAATAGYSGRGDLSAYLRRGGPPALRRIERGGRAAGFADDDEVAATLPAAEDTPELRLLKQRCRGEVRTGRPGPGRAVAARADHLLLASILR